MNFGDIKTTTTFGNRWEYSNGYEEEKQCWAHYKYTLTLTKIKTKQDEYILADASCLKVCACLTDAEAAELKVTSDWEAEFNIPVANGQVETTILYEKKKPDCGNCSFTTPAYDLCEREHKIPIWDSLNVTKTNPTYKQLLHQLETDMKTEVWFQDQVGYFGCSPSCD